MALTIPDLRTRNYIYIDARDSKEVENMSEMIMLINSEDTEVNKVKEK